MSLEVQYCNIVGRWGIATFQSQCYVYKPQPRKEPTTPSGRGSKEACRSQRLGVKVSRHDTPVGTIGRRARPQTQAAESRNMRLNNVTSWIGEAIKGDVKAKVKQIAQSTIMVDY